MSGTIVVNASENGQKISRHIYGHFAEHLGRCVYGGFWVGKQSPIPNIDGYRKDVAEAFKKLRIPNLRWPGGCFADEYHWKDGIGPQEQRKRIVNTNWGGVVEDNSFGTHEFLGLCELLECEPYICGNVGSGTVQEMDEWIEYMTFNGESPMANLRKENGREKPWTLPFFGVGNENWGCGGSMRPEFYADQYRRFQTFVRQYNKDHKIYKIAGGANSFDWNWTTILMKNAGRHMDGLSLHFYTIEGSWEQKGNATKFDENGWIETLRNALRMEELVRRHGEIMDTYDPEKRVGLVVDEWGCWHQVEEGTNPGFLYQQNTMRDALVASITLNIFNNHCDRVKIANLAQAVNVLQSPVLTEGNKMVLTPTYHVLDMYKNHMDAKLLKTSVAAPDYVCGEISIPGESVSASQAADGSMTVTFCNTNPNESLVQHIEFAGLQKRITEASARVLSADTMTAHNTFEKPDTVSIHLLKTDISETGKSVSLQVPPMSVISVLVK